MMKKAKAKHRIMAFLFDWVIVYFFCVLLMLFPIVNFIKDYGNATKEEVLSLVICLILFSLSCFIFIVFYFVILPVLLKGQTLGKKFFGIKIVKQNGDEVDYATLFVRELIGKVLIDFASFGLTVFIRAITLSLKGSYYSFQDVLTNTMVIDIE